MLLFGPLVAALAAGNTAVLKPSEIATHCAAAAARLVPKYFDPRAVAVVEGAVPETTALLAQKWDMIFFTGSSPVGKRTRSKSSTARTRSRARTTDA